MDFTEWLEQITSDSQSEIAEKIGMSRRTLQNQLYGTPKIETIIKIADEYDTNPLVTLVDLDYVDARWLEDLTGNLEAAARSMSEEMLSDEVLRRMLRGVETDSLTTPANDLAERRRSNSSTPGVHSGWQDYAVADESPDHEEEDTDFD